MSFAFTSVRLSHGIALILNACRWTRRFRLNIHPTTLRTLMNLVSPPESEPSRQILYHEQGVYNRSLFKLFHLSPKDESGSADADLVRGNDIATHS